MARMPSFLAIGDVLLDVLLRRGDGTHAARALARPGGSAANAAVWAAAAGAVARCAGRVGDDAAGRALRAELEARGVDARLAVDPELPTGVAADVDGRPAVDRGATARLVPGDLDGLLDVDVVLISGHLLGFPETRPAAAAALSARGPAWRAVDGGVRTHDPGLLDGADALFLAAEPESDPEPLARAAGERQRLVCVTLGEAGAVGVLDGELARAAPPVVHPGPARGAGDAFAAGVLVALASGHGLEDALVAGCALGAAAAGATDGWPAARPGPSGPAR
jgi:sugar/nucleoside kinase (ribokinase family)